MSEKPLLRPEEVQGVLSGSAPAPDDAVQPYSLRDPMAIPPDAQRAARAALERVIAILGESLSSAAEIELTLDDLQQQTATSALSALPPPAWVANLHDPASGGLALALHPGVALALVDVALGGPGGVPEEPRGPTALESRVLKRFVANAAERISGEVGARFQPLDCTTGAVPRTVATPGETLAVGLLRFHIGEADHVSILMMTASLLVPREADSAAEEIGRPGPLAGLLERVALNVAPVLEAGTVSFHDIMALESGKVLRLDAAEDAPFELRAEGHPVARGRIVRREERSVFTVESTRSTRQDEPSSEEDPA